MAKGFVLTSTLAIQAPNMRNVVRNINNQLKGVNANVNVNLPKGTASQLQTVSQNLQNVSNNAKAAGRSAQRMGSSFRGALSYLMKYDLARSIINAFVNTIRDGVTSAIAFEREMVKVSQVTGKTMNSLKGLEREITSLSTSLGVSSSSLVKTSRVLAQTGMTAREVRISLDALAKTTLAATFDDITSTTETAIAAMRQFNIEASNLERELGRINALAANFAVEAGDIGVAIRRAGGAFKAAGGQLMELEAMFTAVRSTTRETAETIATGFRTIFTRIQRPKTIQFLRQVGVELQDLAGNFVGPYEAVRRLNIALKDLDPRDVRYSQIVEQLGGFRQVSKVIPLIQQFGVAQKALNVAQSGGTSLARDAAKAQQSVAVQVVKVKEEFQALFRTFMGSSGMQAMVKMALELAKALATVAETLGPMIPMLTALSAAKGVAFLAGGMGRGRNQGGRINRFASGGMVPGRGNRDTVPAMLTPGEFVIRKSSVKAIGTDRLRKMNRYASGGTVEQMARKKPSIKTLGFDEPFKRAKSVFDGLQGGDKVKGIVNRNKISRADVEKMYKGAQREQVLGTLALNNKASADMFEAVAAKKSRMKLIPGNAPMDLKGKGLKYGEVKFKGGRERTKSILNKALRQHLTDKTKKLKDVGPEGALTSKRDTIDLGSVDIWEAKSKKEFTTAKYDPTGTADKKQQRQIGKASIFSRPRKRRNAGGGLPRSSDTVPALLTPGEFVINRKSAQRIGYGNLNRANRFGETPRGFAKGGAVGGVRVQKFNEGGKADPSARALGLMFGLEMLLPMFAANIEEVDGEINMMKEGLNALTQTLMMATAAHMLFGEKLTEMAGKIGISGGQVLGITAIAGTFFAYHKAMENAAKKMQDFAMKSVEAGGYKTQSATEEARARVTQGAAQEAESTGAGWGALSGAATGGAIGAKVFGIPGLIAGGIIGGVVGGVSGGALADAEGAASEALINFNAKVRSLRLGDALSDVERKLKLFTEGKASGRAIAASVSDGIDRLDRSFAEITTVEELESFNGLVQKSIPGFADFINRMAANVDSFAELEQIVGTDTLNSFSELSGVSLERMKKEIQDGVEVRKRSKAAQEAQIKSIRQLNKVLYGARDAVSAFAAIEHRLTAFDNALTNAEQSINNTFGQAALGKIAPNFDDISNILDFSAFNRHVDNISATLGSSGVALGKDLKQFAALNSLLPNILTEAAGEIGIGGARASEIIEAKLMAADPGGIIGDEFRKMIVRRVQAAAEMGEGGEGKFAGRIREDIQGVVRDLTKGMSETQQAFQRAAEFIDKANARLAKAYDLRTKLELKIVQQQQNILQLQYENAERIRKLRKQPANEQAAGQSFATQQNFLLAGTAVAGFGTNIGVVSTEFIRLKEKIRKSNAELESFGLDPAAVTGQLTESQKKLLDENARLKEQFAKTKMVLENYSNVQQRLAVISERLAEEELKRSQLVSAGEKFAFATNEARVDIMKAMRATAMAMQGGLGRIPDQMRPQVLSILDQFSEIAMFNGMTGKQAKAELTIAELERVFGPLPDEMKKAIRGATSEQERLIQEQIKIQKQAEQAQMALLVGMKEDRKDLAKTIAGLHKQLTTELKNIFLRQEQRTLERELSEAKGNRVAAENGFKELQKIRSMGLPVEDPRVLNAIRVNIESIRGLREARQTRQRFAAAAQYQIAPNQFADTVEGRGAGAANQNAINNIAKDLRRNFGVDVGNKIAASLRSALSGEIASRQGQGQAPMTASEVQAFLQRTLTQFAQEQMNIQGDVINQAMSTLNSAGIGQFADTLVNNFDALSQSLANIPQGETWQSLSDDIVRLGVTINKTNNSIAANMAAIGAAAAGGAGPAGGAGGNVPVFATGGSVFAPKGTDTVPAMLTPGEFVVNKKAAKRNMAALQSINSGKTNYLAGGGVVMFNGVGPAAAIKQDQLLKYHTPFMQGAFGALKESVRNAIMGTKDQLGNQITTGIQDKKSYEGSYLSEDVDFTAFPPGFNSAWNSGTSYQIGKQAYRLTGAGLERWAPNPIFLRAIPDLAQNLQRPTANAFTKQIAGFDARKYGETYRKIIQANGMGVATPQNFLAEGSEVDFSDRGRLNSAGGDYVRLKQEIDEKYFGPEHVKVDRMRRFIKNVDNTYEIRPAWMQAVKHERFVGQNSGVRGQGGQYIELFPAYTGQVYSRSRIQDWFSSEKNKSTLLSAAYPSGTWKNLDVAGSLNTALAFSEKVKGPLQAFKDAHKLQQEAVAELYGTSARSYLSKKVGAIQEALKSGNNLNVIDDVVKEMHPDSWYRGFVSGGTNIWEQTTGTGYTSRLKQIAGGVKKHLIDTGFGANSFRGFEFNPANPSSWGSIPDVAAIQAGATERSKQIDRVREIFVNYHKFIKANNTSAGYGTALDALQTALFGGVAIQGMGAGDVEDAQEAVKDQQEKDALANKELKDDVNENFKFMKSPILTGSRLASHMNKVTNFMMKNRIKSAMPKYAGINRRWLQNYEFDENTAHMVFPFFKGLGHDLQVMIRGGFLNGMDASGLKINQERISEQLGLGWDAVHQSKGKIRDVSVKGVTGAVGPGANPKNQGIAAMQGLLGGGNTTGDPKKAMTFIGQRGLIGRLNGWANLPANEWGYGKVEEGQRKMMDLFFGGGTVARHLGLMQKQVKESFSMAWKGWSAEFKENARPFQVKPVTKADGGTIFAPKGTDTVPAMLTPGEFVVNRKAAQKNMGALQALNSGKTQYLAEGGLVDPKRLVGAYLAEAEEHAESHPDENNRTIKNWPPSRLNPPDKDHSKQWIQTYGRGEAPGDLKSYARDKRMLEFFAEQDLKKAARFIQPMTEAGSLYKLLDSLEASGDLEIGKDKDRFKDAPLVDSQGNVSHQLSEKDQKQVFANLNAIPYLAQFNHGAFLQAARDDGALATQYASYQPGQGFKRSPAGYQMIQDKAPFKSRLRGSFGQRIADLEKNIAEKNEEDLNILLDSFIAHRESYNQGVYRGKASKIENAFTFRSTKEGPGNTQIETFPVLPTDVMEDLYALDVKERARVDKENAKYTAIEQQKLGKAYYKLRTSYKESQVGKSATTEGIAVDPDNPLVRKQVEDFGKMGMFPSSTEDQKFAEAINASYEKLLAAAKAYEIPEKPVTYATLNEHFGGTFDPRDIDKDGIISPYESPPVNLQDKSVLDIIETQAGSWWRQMKSSEIDSNLMNLPTGMGNDKAEFDRQRKILQAAKPWREYFEKVVKVNPQMGTMGTAVAARGKVDTETQKRDYMKENIDRTGNIGGNILLGAWDLTGDALKSGMGMMGEFIDEKIEAHALNAVLDEAERMRKAGHSEDSINAFVARSTHLAKEGASVKDITREGIEQSKSVNVVEGAMMAVPNLIQTGMQAIPAIVSEDDRAGFMASLQGFGDALTSTFTGEEYEDKFVERAMQGGLTEQQAKDRQGILDLAEVAVPGMAGSKVGKVGAKVTKNVVSTTVKKAKSFANDIAEQAQKRATQARHSAEVNKLLGQSSMDILTGKKPGLGELTKPKPAPKGPVKPDAAVDDLLQGMEPGTFDPLNRGKFTPDAPEIPKRPEAITADMRNYVEARGQGPARKTYIDPETGKTYKSDFGAFDPQSSFYTDIIPGKGKTTFETKPGLGFAARTYDDIINDATLTTAQKQAMIKNLPPGQVPKGAKPNAFSAADEVRIQQGKNKLAELEAKKVKRPGGDPEVTIDWLQKAKEEMFNHPGSLNVGSLMDTVEEVAQKALGIADDIMNQAKEAVTVGRWKVPADTVPKKPVTAVKPKPAAATTPKPAAAAAGKYGAGETFSLAAIDQVDDTIQVVTRRQAQVTKQADDAAKQSVGELTPAEQRAKLDAEIALSKTQDKFLRKSDKTKELEQKRKDFDKDQKEAKEAAEEAAEAAAKNAAEENAIAEDYLNKFKAGQKDFRDQIQTRGAENPEGALARRRNEAQAMEDLNPTVTKQDMLNRPRGKTQEKVSPVGKEVLPNKMLEDIKVAQTMERMDTGVEAKDAVMQPGKKPYTPANAVVGKTQKLTRGPKEPRPTLKQVQEQYAGRPISPGRQAAMNKRLAMEGEQLRGGAALDELKKQDAIPDSGPKAIHDWDNVYGSREALEAAKKEIAMKQSRVKKTLSNRGVPQKFLDEVLEGNEVLTRHYDHLMSQSRTASKNPSGKSRNQLKDELAEFYKKEAKNRGYAKGGFVSLFNTGGPAMGTDTVPAMLTPGEFVVRKAAVDAVGIETLKSINSMGAGHTNNRSKKSRGTNYLAGGGEGEVTGGTNMYRLDSSAFTDAVGSFDSSVKRLEELFKGGIQMSHKIEDMNVIVSVNHNGEPTDDGEMSRGMQRKIRREVSRGINSFIERQFPDMPRMDIEGTA